MGSRITRVFRALRARGRKAFIPYVMAGDPSLERTRQLLGLLQASGADLLELGVPFTDPLADGPVIQAAAQRALRAGANLTKVLSLLRSMRAELEVPVVLMTYYNPVFRYGLERFAQDALRAGLDGLIVPDLPMEECGELRRHLRGVDLVLLAAPTSPPERLRRLARLSQGFLYYVSITGITGAKLRIEPAARRGLEFLRKNSPRPVAVGFGVWSPREASLVASLADGVIVGSAIVRKAHEEGLKGLRPFLRSLREAI
jgi:tryptophan synthase alpha chain